MEMGMGMGMGTKKIGTYVPCGSTVVNFRSIVISFTMAAKEKDLVFDVAVRVLIELLDLVVEALPLGVVVVFV